MSKPTQSGDPQLDAELDAIKLIVATLDPLSEEARSRIIGSLAVLHGLADWTWRRRA